MEAAAFDARKLGEWGEYVHTHSSSGSKSEMNEGGTGFFTSFLGRASRSATADLGPLVDLTAAVFEPAAGCAYLSEYGTQGAHRGRREGGQWHGLQRRTQYPHSCSSWRSCYGRFRSESECAGAVSIEPHLYRLDCSVADGHWRSDQNCHSPRSGHGTDGERMVGTNARQDYNRATKFCCMREILTIQRYCSC
jgi:hypothetical protein